jgi:type I restriction enzyme S subunit
MAAEWREMPFGLTVTVNPRVQLARGATYPFVDMGAVSAGSRSAYASEQRPFNGGGSRFAVGDTLMARITPCLENGKIARFMGKPGEIAHGSTEFIVIRGREGVSDTDFAYYLTKWEEVSGFAISQMTGTSGRQRVPTEALDHLEVPVPPLPEQRAIAHILGTLDDKIELNRRMSDTLEAMARALFRSWFVDFDPVQAKAAGRDSGLPKHIADLFPESFEDSEFGEIPTGWTAVRLPDVIEVNPGRTIKKGDVAPYLDMANMPTRGHSPDDVFDRAFGSGMRFKNGDTLVARITPCLENGKTAYVDFLLDEQIGWGSTEYIVLRPKPPLPLEFAYCLARSSRFREFAIQSMTGSSGRQRVPAESLYHYLLVTPSPEIAEHFGHVARALFSRASNAARESRALAAVRDSLLPKLVSGEIRIKNPEEIVRTLRPQEVAATK